MRRGGSNMATWAIVLMFVILVALVLLFAGWAVWRGRHYLSMSRTSIGFAADRSPTDDDWQDVPEAWRRALDTVSDAVAVPAPGNRPAAVGESAPADLPRFSSGSDRSRVGSRSRVTAHAPLRMPGARQATPSLLGASTTASAPAVSPCWTYWEGLADRADPLWHRHVARPRSSDDRLPPRPEIAAKLQQVMLKLMQAGTGPSGNLEHSFIPAASRMAAGKTGQTRDQLPAALAIASTLRAPGAQAQWTFEIEWTPSPSADAPLVPTARQPGQTRAKPGRPHRAQHASGGREDVTSEHARNPTIIVIDTAVLDVLIAAVLEPPSPDATNLHNLITVIEIAIQPRWLVIRAVTMTVSSILKAHGLGLLAPGAGRILTRILVPVLNLILGPGGRHATLLKILDDLDVGFNAFKGRPTDSTVFRSDLADWLAGARGATAHSSTHQPSTAYAPPPPTHSGPAHGPVWDVPSRPQGHKRRGASWRPAWVPEPPPTSRPTDPVASPPWPGPIGSGYQAPTPTDHPTPTSAAGTRPPSPLPTSPAAGKPDPVTPPPLPAADNPGQRPRTAIPAVTGLPAGTTPPTTFPRPPTDAPKPQPVVTHPAHKPSAPGPADPSPAARSACEAVPGNAAPRRHPVQVLAQPAPEPGQSVPPERNGIVRRRHRAPAARTDTPQLAPPTVSSTLSLPDNTNNSAPAGPPEGRSSLREVAKHFGPPSTRQSALEPEGSVRPASAGPSMGGDTAPPATTASRWRSHPVPTAPHGPVRRSSDDETTGVEGLAPPENSTKPTKSRRPGQTPSDSLQAVLAPRYTPPPPRAPRSPAAGMPSPR